MDGGGIGPDAGTRVFCTDGPERLSRAVQLEAYPNILWLRNPRYTTPSASLQVPSDARSGWGRRVPARQESPNHSHALDAGAKTDLRTS